MKILSNKKFLPKIMGVLNTNEDSFFHGSRFKEDKALLHVNKMIEEGASIIDLGGVSSRPGSIGVSEEEELRRVRPIIDMIYATEALRKSRIFN